MQPSLGGFSFLIGVSTLQDHWWTCVQLVSMTLLRILSFSTTCEVEWAKEERKVVYSSLSMKMVCVTLIASFQMLPTSSGVIIHAPQIIQVMGFLTTSECSHVWIFVSFKVIHACTLDELVIKVFPIFIVMLSRCPLSLSIGIAIMLHYPTGQALLLPVAWASHKCMGVP